MSNSIFTFNPIELYDRWDLFSKAINFLVGVDDLNKLQITENKFNTEDFGGCWEKVDIFVVSGEDIIDFDSIDSLGRHFVPELDSGSGYFDMSSIYQKAVEYHPVKSLMVVIRTLSTFQFDQTSVSCKSMVYNLCSKELSAFLTKHPDISGLISKHNIMVGDDFINDIIKGMVNLKETHKISDTMYDEYMCLLESL